MDCTGMSWRSMCELYFKNVLIMLLVYAALRSERKNWLDRNQDEVFEWSDI
jgi:hypothetical protein